MHLESRPQDIRRYTPVPIASRTKLVSSAAQIRRFESSVDDLTLFDNQSALQALEVISFALGRNNSNRYLIDNGLEEMYSVAYDRIKSSVSNINDADVERPSSVYWRQVMRRGNLDKALVIFSIFMPALSLFSAVVSLVFSVSFFAASDTIAFVFSFLVFSLCAVLTVVILDWQRKSGLGAKVLVDSEGQLWTLQGRRLSHR
jgi:hypothetical protein